MERFERFRFSVPAVPLRRGFLCVSVQSHREDGSGSGFRSWKTVPAVPVPRSVPAKTQKKRGVHKISARNSGTGNGCANFMGAWHFLVLSAGKPPHAHKIPPSRGGCRSFLEGGGGSANFIFMGAGIFPKNGSDGSGFRFRFGSWVTLKRLLYRFTELCGPC